jgi:hypothetical protein
MYPSKLQPDATEGWTIDGNNIEIPVIHKVFKKWNKEPIQNTFGGKPLVDYKGIPVFAELAIQRLAKDSGWDARWIETYQMKINQPYFFDDWTDASISKQATLPINNEAVTRQLQMLSTKNNNSYYGCWDVLAWKGNRIIYIESKRSKKDKIRDTQTGWFKAGLASGLKPENFLIVQWGFSLDELVW